MDYATLTVIVQAYDGTIERSNHNWGEVIYIVLIDAYGQTHRKQFSAEWGDEPTAADKASTWIDEVTK